MNSSGESVDIARLREAANDVSTAVGVPDYEIFAAVAQLRHLQFLQHAYCVNAGWYDNPHTGRRVDRNVGEMLALIHSEVSEALEGHRRCKFDEHLPHRAAIEVELADVLLRVLDLAGYLRLDLGAALVEKWAYNTKRIDHMHSQRTDAGGKAF